MIKAILIDAMFTVFIPRLQLSRYELYRYLIKDLTGQDLSLSSIKQIYQQKRTALEDRPYRSHYRKWVMINTEILMALFPGMTKSQARRLARAVTNAALSPDFYQVQDSTRRFLTEARERGLKVFMASNHEKRRLRALVRGFNLQSYFAAIYASSEIGYEKPDYRFFNFILRRESLHPEECVMIGNNPVNDVRGSEALGMRGILYDPEMRYPDFSGYKITQFAELWALDIFQRG